MPGSAPRHAVGPLAGSHDAADDVNQGMWPRSGSLRNDPVTSSQQRPPSTMPLHTAFAVVVCCPLVATGSICGKGARAAFTRGQVLETSLRCTTWAKRTTVVDDPVACASSAEVAATRHTMQSAPKVDFISCTCRTEHVRHESVSSGARHRMRVA